MRVEQQNECYCETIRASSTPTAFLFPMSGVMSRNKKCLWALAGASLTAACPSLRSNDAGPTPLVDAGVDAPPAANDAGPEMLDAFRPPVELIYRNPEPPACLDRDQPPRWRSSTLAAEEGTVLWRALLLEERFNRWRAAASGGGMVWPWAPPSLSGDGVVTWFSSNVREETWALGLSSPDGSFANSGRFDNWDSPRMWLPRLRVLLLGHGAFGRALWAPEPDLFYPESERPPVLDAGVGSMFWVGGPVVVNGRVGDMPAWSPQTGDLVTFGVSSSTGVMGAGAACSEGTRWYTQLPIHPGLNTAFVRPDGDAIIASVGESWVLDGTTGEPLRTASYVDDAGIPGRPAAYQPGCGILLEFVPAASWRWLNDETMTLGPLLTFPADRPTNNQIWAGTTDCGMVGVGGRDSLYLTRVNADGAVRYSSPVEPAGVAALRQRGSTGLAHPPRQRLRRVRPRGGACAGSRRDALHEHDDGVR